MPKRNDIILEICENLTRTVNLKAYKGKAASGMVRLSRQQNSSQTLRESSAVARNMNGTINKQVKCVADVIQAGMSNKQKKQLLISVNELFQNIPLTDVSTGLNFILENETLKTSILERISDCFHKNMDLRRLPS